MNIDAALWQAALLSLVSSTTVVGILVFIQNRMASRDTKPLLSADTNATNLEAQGKTVDRLAKENERLAKRLEATERKVDMLLARDEKRETDLRAAESKIDELEARDEARDRLWRAHASWDDELEMVVRRMTNVEVKPRPPLELPGYPTP